jgi:hypothetical protein
MPAASPPPLDPIADAIASGETALQAAATQHESDQTTIATLEQQLSAASSASPAPAETPIGASAALQAWVAAYVRTQPAITQNTAVWNQIQNGLNQINAALAAAGGL